MSQMDLDNQDFDGVEFTIEQENNQVWLRWAGQDDSVLLGRVEVVADKFRKWLSSFDQQE